MWCGLRAIRGTSEADGEAVSKWTHAARPGSSAVLLSSGQKEIRSNEHTHRGGRAEHADIHQERFDHGNRRWSLDDRTGNAVDDESRSSSWISLKRDRKVTLFVMPRSADVEQTASPRTRRSRKTWSHCLPDYEPAPET